jgi:UDP-N-acetylglucosamine:LPS N-acetylglucosamine transferase
MNGFLSPVSRNALGFAPPDHVRFININLPAMQEYHDLSSVEGDINSVLLVCGFWGQGPIAGIVKKLSGALPDLKIHAVCGENQKAYEKLQHLFNGNDRIQVYGVTPSLVPSLRECASVITKPGISTLLESHAAARKIFLLKGMPVAEDNNARFAIEHFGAERFEVETFKRWYMSQQSL